MSHRYPAEFKQKAVELVITQRKSIVQVSLELCVCKSILCYWPNHQGQGSRAARLGRASMHLTKEIKRLRAERDDAMQENCVVKLVLGYFRNHTPKKA